MGFFKRLKEAALPDFIDDNFHHSAFDGENFPDGSVCAVGIGQPGVDVDVAPGEYAVTYRVRGEPKYYAQSKNWQVPSFEFEFTPLDRATTPQAQLEQAWGSSYLVKQIGWSSRALYKLHVPAPGGRYHVAANGANVDDEANVLIKPAGQD